MMWFLGTRWLLSVLETVLKEESLSFFGRMHERDMKIDDFTIPSILNCFASSRTETKIASSVHCLIVKTGYGTYKLVNNSLVDMYAKRGIMDSAVKVFKGMIEKDVIILDSSCYLDKEGKELGLAYL